MLESIKWAMAVLTALVGIFASADTAVPFPSPDTELNDVDPRVPLGRYVQYEASNTVVNTVVLTNGVITVGDSSVNVSFTSSNTQLVSTIQAVAPAPGNYSAVSNRAMSSIQSLEPSTNYTDKALADFAATGTVWRSLSYGTTNRWTDATGCVWQVVFPHFTEWVFYGVPSGYTFYMSTFNGALPGYSWALENDGGGYYEQGKFYVDEDTETTLDIPTNLGTVTCTREWIDTGTNLVGCVALTNDIPPAVAVVAPSTNAAAGTAADAKATGTVLYTGFTEWEFEGLSPLVADSFTFSNGVWTLAAHDGVGTYTFYGNGTADATSVTVMAGSEPICIATRHLITPTKTSQLTNDGAPNGGGTPYATTAQVAAKLNASDVVPPTDEATVGQAADAVKTYEGLNSRPTKRRVDEALALKANTSDLHYALVTPGKWEFSDDGTHTVAGPTEDQDGWVYTIDGSSYSQFFGTESEALAALSLTFETDPAITATRASLPGHMCDRAVNNVIVSTPTSLFFPSNIIGKTSDFYLNLVVSNEPQLSVSFFDSDSNPISWVEAPPQNFNVGTNIIHIVEVSENTYIFSKIGTSDSGELTNVRIKGTLSQGHTTAIATGAFSNSQGTNTIAIGVASHAEGSSTTAEGNYAHSEGNGTYARGLASHSEGLFTRATERASHSGGACALATNSWSFVWSGLERSPYYGSHGVSTFNVNPINGLYGFFLGEKTLEEMIADSILSPALVTNIVVAYDTGIEPSDDSTEPATSEVTVTYGTLRAAIATAVGETITNPMSQLGGMSLPEYISTVKKYEWDEARQVSYRRCISNDFIILTYATNIDVTAANNISALKATETRMKLENTGN